MTREQKINQLREAIEDIEDNAEVIVKANGDTLEGMARAEDVAYAIRLIAGAIFEHDFRRREGE